MRISPVQLLRCAGTTGRKLTAPSNFRAIVSAPGSYGLNPQIVLSDPWALARETGSPWYLGNSHAGIGFLQSGRIDAQAPAFYDFTNLCGSGSQHNSCSTYLNIASLETACCGNADPGLNFMIATGTSLSSPSSSGPGTRPGKITWNAYASTGMVQTETASIEGVVDESCRDGGNVPVESNTQCGTNIVIKTTPDTTGSPQIVSVFNQDGALWLGPWSEFGNPSPWSGQPAGTGNGAIVLHDSYGTLSAVPNATVLRSQSGRLYVRLAGSSGEQPLLLQSGGATTGHHACWGNFGELVDCGN
jgi:hypothetical protein